MGEKIAPAAGSNELPVKALRDVLERDGQARFASASSPSPIPSSHTSSSQTSSRTSSHTSDDLPAHDFPKALAPGPTNGNSAEASLTLEKAYFEQLIENAPEAISIIDEERRILRINGEFTRVFGFSGAEAVGRALDQLIVPPDRYAETAWIAE